MRKFLTILGITVITVALVFSFAASKNYKSSRHAWLGIVGESVDRDLAESFDLPSEYGVIIDDILDDSPAEAAGLEEEDIIIGFNNDRIRDYDDLIDMIEDQKPGDEITLTIMRGDNKQEIKATLEGRPRHSKYSNTWFSDDAFMVPRAPRAPRAPKVVKIPSIPKLDRMIYIEDDGAYIGIRMSSLSKQLGEHFGVEKGRGVLITEVEDDSPAQKAGLKAGDVIVAVDGDKVWDFEDVTEVVDESREGDKLSITVMRDKKEVSLDVEVAERERKSRDRIFHWYTGDDVTIHAPHGSGYSHGYYFDSDDFEDEMEDLAEEMKDLQIELKELEWETNEEVRFELQKELQQLKKELSEIEDEIY